MICQSSLDQVDDQRLQVQGAYGRHVRPPYKSKGMHLWLKPRLKDTLGSPRQRESHQSCPVRLSLHLSQSMCIGTFQERYHKVSVHHSTIIHNNNAHATMQSCLTANYRSGGIDWSLITRQHVVVIIRKNLQRQRNGAAIVPSWTTAAKVNHIQHT